MGDVRNEPVGGCRKVVSAEKQKKKEQNELAISTQTRPITHLAGPPTTRVPPLVCSPQLTEKGGPTSLGRGEGLAATAPSRREREKTKGEAVGDKGCQHSLSATFHQWWMTSYRRDYFRDAEIEINDVGAC